MIPVCIACDVDLTSTNHRHPGYCSIKCRDHTRDILEQAARLDREHRQFRRAVHAYCTQGFTPDDAKRLAHAELQDTR